MRPLMSLGEQSGYPQINGGSCPIMRQQSQQYYFEWFICFDTWSYVAKTSRELGIPPRKILGFWSSCLHHPNSCSLLTKELCPSPCLVLYNPFPQRVKPPREDTLIIFHLEEPAQAADGSPSLKGKRAEGNIKSICALRSEVLSPYCPTVVWTKREKF